MKKVWIILPKIDGQDKEKTYCFFSFIPFFKIYDYIPNLLEAKEKIITLGSGEKSLRRMERVTWKSTLPYVKWTAKENFLYGSGNSNRGSVQT